jgi:cytochrome c biogenesis protein CcdA
MHSATHPARKRRWSWAVGLALLLAGCAPAAGATFTQDVFAGRGDKRTKVLELEAVVIPADPFSDDNAVDAGEVTLKRGEVFELVLHGRPLQGWHTYPMTKKTSSEGGKPSTLEYASEDVFKPVWPVQESEAEFEFIDSVGIFLQHNAPFTWRQVLVVDPKAKPGPHALKFTVGVQVCRNTCIDGTLPFDIPIRIAEGPALAIPREVQEALGKPRPEREVVPVPPGVVASLTKEKDRPAGPDGPARSGLVGSNQGGARDIGGPADPQNASIWGLIFQGILWGALSLLTPCVFPMIPITVSFFLKRSEQEHQRTLLSALVYSLTIVVVLTLGGVLLMASIQKFSQHYLTNFFLGGLFLFFALSLFGMYDIALPSGLANFTSSQQGKGGLVGVMFMALTFTIISFTCVAPFYGGFAGLTAAAQSAFDWVKIVLAALAFSLTFAAPFFLLALFPQLLKTLPRSGSWMNTVKVVMGFLEVAAALKFLRAGELYYYFGEAKFLTFDLALGMYVALAILCGLYLLGVYRLPHDHDVPETLGVPRMLFALVFLSLGLYLLPGLFAGSDGTKQRPRGTIYSWVNSFLLPDREVAAAPARSGEFAAVRLHWLGRYREGLEQARKEEKLVFLNFTGMT